MAQTVAVPCHRVLCCATARHGYSAAGRTGGHGTRQRCHGLSTQANHASTTTQPSMSLAASCKRHCVRRQDLRQYTAAWDVSCALGTAAVPGSGEEPHVNTGAQEAYA